VSRARLPLGPVAVGVVLALGAAGTAAAADFEPRRGAWNGLSYFVATAAEAKVELEVHDALDWTTVSPRTIVLLVAPRVGPRRDDPSLSAFMAAGGRLIVADDFRAGYAWLRGFGLRLQNRAGPAGAYVGDLRFLPRFSLRALGPYLAFHDHHADAEPVVVLNHPASLSVREPPPEGMKPRIRGWFGDRARGWLAEVTGAAKVLAVADSSAFINAMMRGFYGNKQLAANVLRYYCYAGEPCRVRLIANLAEISGRFDASAHADEGPPGHADARRSLRRMADRLAELMGRRELALLWSLLVLAAMAVPVLMTSRTPAPMLPPRTVVGRTRSRLQDTVAAWLATQDADYRRPARQLAGLLAQTIAAASPTRGRSFKRAATAPTPTLDELPAMVRGLVASKRLSEQAARRIEDLVVQLRDITGAEPEEIDRQRFTAMAAEVDWAQQVLTHTGEEPGGRPFGSASIAGR